MRARARFAILRALLGALFLLGMGSCKLSVRIEQRLPDGGETDGSIGDGPFDAPFDVTRDADGDDAQRDLEASDGNDDASRDGPIDSAADQTANRDAPSDLGFGAAYALQFDGNDDYLEARVPFSREFTVEGWFRASSPCFGKACPIVQADEPGLPTSADFSIVLTDNDLQFTVGAPAGEATVKIENVQVNDWVFFSASRAADGGLTLTAYSNGEVLISTGNATGNPLSSQVLTIGGSGVLGYPGMIDDVRLWNVVRSSEDVTATMKSSLAGTEPGLVSYWRMNEELYSGPIAFDSTRSANDARFGSGVHSPIRVNSSVASWDGVAPASR